MEENIGIRKSSRFLPVVATFVTAFFFLAAIQNKGKSDLAGNPIEIGEFEIPEGSEWVDLNSSLLRTQNARFTPTDTIESGTVVGGEAKYRLQDKTLYVKAAKSNPQNVSDIRGEMVRITYQYSGSKHKNSSEGHWEAHKKFWDVYGDLEEANKRIDKLTAQFFDSSTKDKKIPGSILSSLISISHPPRQSLRL